MNAPDLFSYPHVPGFKRRDTSVAAAEAIAPKAKSIRDRLMAQFELCHLTADEACALARVHISAGRPRCSELVAQGKLTDTGKRRRNDSGKSAVVWSRA